ncbi:MAG: hypothetical protein J6A75_06270 [Lachnospiraceae bacterium]|nr:hypothetical protein [Lachnospiraceae bacterium]
MKLWDGVDIISDKNHPEYEEHMEWLDWVGYSDGCDMNAINDMFGSDNEDNE